MGNPGDGFWTPSSVPTFEDFVGTAGASVCFFIKSRNGHCTRWTSQKTHIQGLNPFWESKLLQTGSLLISELIPHASFPSTAIFRGLALAAVGFRHHMALARLALAVPFVLLVLQLRRPDSPEMLALRLQQETQCKV